MLLHAALLLLCTLLLVCAQPERVCDGDQCEGGEGGRKFARILVDGWINVPHSYAIVNCFHMVHLLRLFGEELEIYVREPKYYRDKWYDAKQLVYPEPYNRVIQGLKPYRGQRVDLVFRISYPHVLTIDEEFHGAPVILFYTTLGTLYPNDVALALTDQELAEHGSAISADMIRWYIGKSRNLYFLTPSAWAAQGLGDYLASYDWAARHKIITHGVDTALHFHIQDPATRSSFRAKFGVGESDILLVNIGAMSGNKGIKVLLLTLSHLVKLQPQRTFKLLLKCTTLYFCEPSLMAFFDELESDALLTAEESAALLDRHILFTEQTLDSEKLNELYNAADAYVSPYVGEGFNLPVLEAIACALPVFVTANGATEAFVEDIAAAVDGADERLVRVRMELGTSRQQTRANAEALYLAFAARLQLLGRPLDGGYYSLIRAYVEEKYSWSAVARLLRDHIFWVIGHSRGGGQGGANP